MPTLEELELLDPRYSLEELVEACNALLPTVLPEERGSQKLRDEVNPRLVRHLASLGLLDEAGREGREARYGFRHLLQILVARRLMAQGYTAGALSRLLAQTDVGGLKSLLKGGAQLFVSSPDAAQHEAAQHEPGAGGAPNEALSFLRGIGSRSRAAPQPGPKSQDGSQAARQAAPQVPAAQVLGATRRGYVRIVLRPGLEVHVEEGFELPPGVGEREDLAAEFLRELKAAPTASKRRRQGI